MLSCGPEGVEGGNLRKFYMMSETGPLPVQLGEKQ